MQAQNTYEQREPRRVIISMPKISIEEETKAKPSITSYEALKSFYSHIPFEKKCMIVIDYFENKMLPKDISQKHSIDLMLINNFLTKVKAQNLFKYEKRKRNCLVKRRIKKLQKNLMMSIIKEQKESGCSWKELADKYNVNYISLVTKKGKYLEKQERKNSSPSAENLSQNTGSLGFQEEKIKHLEAEVVRLNKIIDSLISK